MAGRAIHPKSAILLDRVIAFASRTINLVELLPENRVGSHIANQLLRCGSSPAANYAEAVSAESRRDFIHKLCIALKELRETFVWLRIIETRKLLPPQTLFDMIQECNELISIFVASVATARKNQKYGTIQAPLAKGLRGDES